MMTASGHEQSQQMTRIVVRYGSEADGDGALSNRLAHLRHHDRFYFDR
jgi:hypothetical protein